MGCSLSKPNVTSPLPRSPTPPRSPPKPATPPPPPSPPPPLPRHKVEIEIDTGKDEGDVVYEVDGYPDPTPPTVETDVKLKNADQWYDDDEFNKASDDADLFDTEAAFDDMSVLSFDAVGGRTRKVLSPGQIKPGTKKKPTLSYTDVDAHAKKAKNDLLGSFEALVKYLSDPWLSDRHSEILIARSILVWMGAQRLENTEVGEPRLDTPKGLLAYLKAGRMTYSTFYATLCRKAGLQCVVIEGLVKAARYEPGDTSLPKANWTAFHCEYGWQLVHPYWVCRALYGLSLGGWTKVEADGMPVSARQTAAEGVVRTTFQERYFMPKPSEFLYECYPNNSSWQLVTPEFKVRSKHEFIDLPYLLSPFHGLGLQWQSERKCVFKSQDGFCRIELKGRTTNAHLLNLQYELFRKNKHGDADDDHSDKLFSRMVFNSRSNEHFVFDIRFPKEGTYKLVVYGGPYKSTALRLFEVLIICEKKMAKSFNLLPLNCADIGYGPGPVSTNAGLLMPSKPNGLIAVNKNDKQLATEIKFHIRDDFVRKHKYSASIYGSDEDRESPQLIDGSDEIRDVSDKKESKYLMLTITKEYHLVITVRLPEQGEYGVTICENIQTGDDVRAKTVCNYLVSTLAYHGTFMKANVRLAKESLLKACNEQVTGEHFKKKIANIEVNLDKCRKQDIKESDEDVCMAETEREFLRCKDLLRDCRLRDNYHVTLKALAVMARYRNRAALRKEIQEAEELRGNQEKVRGDAAKS